MAHGAPGEGVGEDPHAEGIELASVPSHDHIEVAINQKGWTLMARGHEKRRIEIGDR